MSRISSARLFIAAGAVLLAGAAAAAEPITVYANIGQPPKAWLDNGTPRGFAVEAAVEVLQRAGFEPTASLMPFARGLQMTRQGNVMTGVFKTPQRELEYLFSIPLVHEDVIMVVAKGKEFLYATATDLVGKRVGLQNGYFYGDDFIAASPQMTIEGNATASARMKMLAAGRIDVAFLSPGRASFQDSVDDAGLPLDAFTVLDKPLARFADYLIVGRDLPGAADIIARINVAIAAATADGTLAAIMKRHRQ